MIAVHGPHRISAAFNLLTGSRVYLTAVVRDDGEVIRVPAGRLRQIVAEDEELSNLILSARSETAVGEGSMAVRLVHQRLATL